MIPIKTLNCIADIKLKSFPFPIHIIQAGLQAAGLKAHLMCQPLGYRTPDGGSYGWIELPEYPYGNLYNIYFKLKFGLVNSIKLI